MGEYLLKSRGSSNVPKEVYYQCIWIVKDFDRLKELAAKAQTEYILSEADSYSDRISTDLYCEPVGKEAVFKLNCIYKALTAVPREYRDIVLANIKDKQEPLIAHENTIKKWKQVFITELAFNLRLV